MSVLIKGLNIKPCKDDFGGKGLVIIGYDDKLYAVAHEQIIPLPDHGDLIDRQAAIDALEEPCNISDTWTDEYAVGERMQWEKDVKALNSLPSAQPEKVCIANITLSEEQLREAVEKAKNEVVRVLSSAQRTGLWIVNRDSTGCMYGRCTSCGMKQYAGRTKFCPNCGAKMEGEDE